MRLIASLLVSLALAVNVLGKQPLAQYRPLPTLREQNALELKWVEKRYAHIQTLLKKYDYDAWIITQREYAEDTVFKALNPATTTFSARRRTLYLFHTHPGLVSPYQAVSLKDDLWEGLEEVLDKVDPKRIAINIDSDMAFSDGLHSGEGAHLLTKLPKKYLPRLRPSRELGVETIAARVGGEEQLEMYRLLMENVWAMIQEGFSEKVVEVGKTTAEDVEWWFRDVMRWRLGTGTWFPPTVNIYRSPSSPSLASTPTIQPGDLLHVDIGITALNLNTDTQHLAYVLRPNETSPPQGLIDGLRDANKLQDMVRKEMKVGRTGDEVFWAVRAGMDEQGLEGRIYSHPIGDYGHSAGAVIGMQDWQDSIPGGGQNKVLQNYWTSVELFGESHVPEWGSTQRFELEEDVYWNSTTDTFEWVFGQQTEYHIVDPSKRVNGGGMPVMGDAKYGGKQRQSVFQG